MPRRTGGTRSALLDAALDAFAAKGYAGASIREITGVVGVRESAFYAHFAGKRALYDELFTEAGPPIAARAIDELAEDRLPSDFLPRFALMLIDAFGTPRSRKFAAMMMRDAFDSKAQGWRSLRASIDGVLELLVGRFEGWQRAGLIRADVAADTLAYEFIAPIVMTRFLYLNIAAGRAEAARGRDVAKRHAETFLALLEPLGRREGRR